MPTYRMGHIPSEPHKVGLGHPTHLTAAVPALPASVTLPMPPCTDQGNSSSCTGNSTAVAVQAAGDQPWGELPSRLFIYALARAKGGYLPLADEGAQIADCFGAMADLGYPPETAMPFSDDPAVVNKLPTWEANREALDQKYVKGAWRILSAGAQRVKDVAAAIAAGERVVWGVELDDAFMNLTAYKVWPGIRGAVIGGHAMVLHSYRTNGDGLLEFASRSSWTKEFADGGSGWVLEDAIASPHASDFWIVQTAARLEIA